MEQQKRRALVSVTDKRNLDQFARLISTGNWEIVSTGGTARELHRLAIPFIHVEMVTSFPEMMDGRLKTINPLIAGGILANRSIAKHMEDAEKHGIKMIDLVAVNLYDFNSKPDIEQIDIGGPSLLRAAAKNCRFVTVVTDPDDYQEIITDILDEGDTSLDTRIRLATEVFGHTSQYDRDIHGWFLGDLSVIRDSVLGVAGATH